MAMILAAERSSWWDQARETGGFGSSEKKYGSLLLPSVLIPPAKPSQEVWWRWVTIGYPSRLTKARFHTFRGVPGWSKKKRFEQDLNSWDMGVFISIY